MMLVMGHSATCSKVASFLKFFLDLNGTVLVVFNFQSFLREFVVLKIERYDGYCMQF